ncbi:MAG: hypothetical protein KY459_02740 [Acidobacteria bacterium]|nr:hypothetical protein [Acidobacteriota bacterium]
MSFSSVRYVVIWLVFLLTVPVALAIDLGAPVPLTEPLEGAAWSRSESVSAVWDGKHFLAVWIESREVAADGEAFLMSGRFGPEGERLDGHGIELDRRTEIGWARVVLAGGSPHVVYQVPGQLLVVRIEENFELTPVLSFGVSIQDGDAAGNGNRILITWSNWDQGYGPVQAVIADVSTGMLNGPIVIDDGYEPSVAVDGEGFLVTYNERWSPPGGIRAARIGSGGTVQSIIVIEETAGRQGPSAAFTGSGHLIAYGPHDYPHRVRIRFLSAEGELGESRSWDAGDFGRDRMISNRVAADCSSDQCLVVAELSPVCHFSPCLVPSDLFLMRFDLDGNPLDEEWTLLRDVSFTSSYSRIASSDSALFVTWAADSRGYGSLIEGSDVSETFYLSSGATNQRNPVGADREDDSLVVWSESGDFDEERCLRAALLSRSGRRIAGTSISDCSDQAGRWSFYRTGMWSVSGNESSWLTVWRDYDEELQTGLIRGRIMQPHDLTGETFLVAEEYPSGIASAGGSSGHVVVWRHFDGLVATRISSTGQIMGNPWPVLWGNVDQPLLVRLGSGFALVWDGGYCPGETCGLQYRFLTADGHTYGDPVAIASRGFTFDAVEAPGGEALLVWRDSLPKIRAAFIRADGSLRDLGVIGTADMWGPVRVGRDGDGFLVAVERNDGSLRVTKETLLIRLDASGRVEGEPHHFEGRIQEVVGDGLLIEQRNVESPPFYGAPRLFLRPTEDEPAPRRRRPVRRP